MSDIKIVSGIVESTGMRLSGKGFSSYRKDTGIYIISFDYSFEELPAIVGSVYDPNEDANSFLFMVVNLQVKQFTAKITNTNNQNVYNRNFSFIAMALDTS